VNLKIIRFISKKKLISREFLMALFGWIAK